MTVIGILVLLICLAAFAAPFAMRQRKWIWWSRIFIAFVCIALISSAAVRFYGDDGKEFGLWLLRIYILGEVVQLFFRGLEIYANKRAFYSRLKVDYKMESPYPIIEGSVATRPAPAPAPPAPAEVESLLGDPNYHAGTLRQFRA